MSAADSSRHKARRTETDEKITVGVFEVLRRRGWAGLSVEAVSEASGVAKTTIYRRYKDRYEMISGVASQVTVVDGDYSPDLAGLKQILTDMISKFATYGGTRAIGGMLVGDSDEIAELRSKLVDNNLVRLQDFVTGMKEAGSIAPETDVDTVCDVIFGGILYGGARSGRSEIQLIDAVVDLVWPSIRA